VAETFAGCWLIEVLQYRISESLQYNRHDFVVSYISLMARNCSTSTTIRSPLRYPGGKQKVLSEVIRMFPDNVFEYRDPMVGGASVFLHARQKAFAQKYWINDALPELMAFWRVVQSSESCSRLMSDLQQLYSSFSSPEDVKKYFLRAKSEIPSSDYRCALLFFFFNRVTFSGTTQAGGFSKVASLTRFTPSSIQRLKDMPHLLSDVRITNMDFDETILEDGKDVFIFLDPPHLRTARIYGPKGALNVSVR
jgi:DNA adenine methylase